MFRLILAAAVILLAAYGAYVFFGGNPLRVTNVEAPKIEVESVK